ncbi:MAG: hypothetical protein JXA18_09425 [Chitinispirillaceae bacterium]|nr:hypothetical protein [Chitinispirillaceae bacterium]
MNRLIVIILFYFSVSYAIGYQHGIFASQSTQGVQWRGTSAIVAEHYTITVMPSYLDIELDWEFDCTGSQEPDSFKNALEIVGNLNLVQDAAVTGMLLWNGDEILKARLKPIQLAREEYEKVVDRNADTIRRPRDPVIFEYGWGEDNYDISIFPVTWQGSRRLRMRYVVAAINMNGYADIPFPTAFNRSIATYCLTAGPGVSSFEFIDNNGESEKVASPADFTAESERYRRAVMVRPVIENSEGKSIFFTSSINLEMLKGSLTHVVGRTGAQVLATAQIKEDYVILWRWNHAEYIKLYARQIVRQAESLKQFLTRLSDADKRAALVIDISGSRMIVFELGNYGDESYRQMLHFVDSLAGLDYTDDRQTFNPGFSQQQIDSIVALSMEEFEGAIRLAMSLFEEDDRTIRRIVLLTAGPRWITKLNYQFVFEADPGVEITPYFALAGALLPEGTPVPSDAVDFYWPGIPLSNIRQGASSMSVEAILTTESGDSMTVPVSASNALQRYSWNFRSSHLDRKLHTSSKLLPQIEWRIFNNGVLIKEIAEEPVVVTMPDAIQFGCALAGTERLESVDGTLPASLASTFGFVDRSYALLALEEDVMDPLDQERYRIAGVPPLTNADIFRIPDESVPPEKKADAQATVVPEKQCAHAAEPMAPVMTMQKSRLTITFRAGAGNHTPRFATIGIYTLSGRVILYMKNKEIRNNTIRLALPEAIRYSQQTLIVSITYGGMSFTRSIALR